ncbi:MAG: hypothetical protein AAF645_29625, partial [Myxococcota bacterium]
LLPTVSVYRDRARWSATPDGGGPECVLEIEYDSRRGGRAPERRSRLRLECSNEVVFSSDTTVLGELHEGGCVVEVWGERAEYFCVQRVQYARDDRQAIGLHLDTSSRSLRLEREGESVRYWLQLLEPGSAPNVAPPVVSVERARQELSCSAEVLSRTGARIGGFQARPGEACDVRLRFQGAQQQSTEACWLHVRCGEGRDLPVYGDGRGTCNINDNGSVAYFVDSEGSTGDGDPVVVFSQTMDRMVIVDRAGDMPSALHLATECDGHPMLSAFGETSTSCRDPYPALEALLGEAGLHGSSDLLGSDAAEPGHGVLGALTGTNEADH